jgi:PhoPQ-activated pathogenicity-related protein
MMVTRSDFVRGVLAASAAGALPSPALSAPSAALDRFIAAPTPEYHFKLVRTIEGDRYRTHVVSMVSQRWRTDREVDRSIWRHWLSITEPRRIKTPVGVLVISGGSNNDPLPHRVNPVIDMLAMRTGAVIAELNAVPNQPLTFRDNPKPLGEDDLVAYSWNKYLHTGDETWPLRLPMTKAVVRAMDTITSITARSAHGPVVDRFVVGGSSKRGWTAWLTAAADKRVVAVVPVVIDVLNIEQSVEHAYRVYGTWPEALRSYEKMGIMKWLGTQQLHALLQIEDPYSYRDRLTMPKLIVNASGDEFFTPDSSQFYYSGLTGEKYLRYLPNTDHSLKGETVTSAETGIAFLDAIIAGARLPDYSWQMDTDGTIRVRSAEEPLSVKLWHAVNPHARDFRLESIGRAFRPARLQNQGDYTYMGKALAPAHGFAASFVELTYGTQHDDLFTVTTGVRVMPNVLPYPPPPIGR